MKKNYYGFSLIEMLVVIALFAILSVVVSQSLLTSLSNSRKSQTIIKVRENLNYVLSIAERKLRNADSITSCPVVGNVKTINYVNEDGQNAFFTCSTGSTSSFIASEDGALTADDINITNCNFTCTIGIPSVPDRVDLEISAIGENVDSEDESPLTLKTTIYLRIY